METFISVEEARAIIAAHLPSPQEEVVPLDAALGRYLLTDVVSGEAVPPFPNSAMDGFAVRHADLSPEGGVLRIDGEVRAGQWPDSEVGAGSCFRIMTGAPMPGGADAVVPVEWTRELDGGRVEIDRGIAAGKHVRPAGEDIAEGTRVLRGGMRVSAAEIGVLATVGKSEVPVGRRPRVSVVSTGDELVEPSDALKPGQIRNSNGPALGARVASAGGVVQARLVARDNREDVERVVQEALAADVCVFSGGVSVGDYDLVRDALVDAGMELLFWKVRQRPGKPLAFGTLDGKPIFGLPGNPVSSSVCFDQYVRSALVSIQGGNEERTVLKARLAHDFRKPAGLHVFARGVWKQKADGTIAVAEAGAQGSNLSTSLTKANGIVHLPAGWKEAPEGAEVEIELNSPSS